MTSLSSPPPSSSNPHILVFPFMSKGHTIPLLHLSKLLLDRGVDITIFTTRENRPFISRYLTKEADATIIDLPFPRDIQGVPNGAESTDRLPSVDDLFVPFARATELMQPAFEQELEKLHSRASCMISDGFLPWTLKSASKFGIPRLSFLGMGYYSSVVAHDAMTTGMLWRHGSDNEPFALAGFPSIQLSRDDFDEPFRNRDPRGPYLDFIIESSIASENSYGLIMNTFYELEKAYADYHNRECKPRAWSIGPLCLAKLHKDKPLASDQNPKWMQWLDEELAGQRPVLYVAFGSQARIPPTQIQEIGLALEEGEVSYLWVARKSEVELLSFDPSKVKKRGMVVTEWVDQEEILEHPSVKGFLSHCGWNSVLEGICAGVPILAWPMMADQFLNAKMVVEEMKVGLRVKTVDGRSKGFVSAEILKDAVREMMESEKGKEVREKAKELSEAAVKATTEGGSSWNALNNLLSEIQKKKET